MKKYLLIARMRHWDEDVIFDCEIETEAEEDSEEFEDLLIEKAHWLVQGSEFFEDREFEDESCTPSVEYYELSSEKILASTPKFQERFFKYAEEDYERRVNRIKKREQMRKEERDQREYERLRGKYENENACGS